MTQHKVLNLSVLVTRPATKSQQLIDALAQQKIKATAFPLIDIKPLPDTQIDQSLQAIKEHEKIICVSANAATLGLKSLQRLAIDAAAFEWFAIGSSTAKVLRDAGITVRLPDAGVTSEDLLALLKNSTVNGVKILIWRGQGGRELLGEKLTALGAQVGYAEFYQRTLPAYAKGALDATLEQYVINTIVVSSGQGLQHLCQLSLNIDELKRQWLVVPSQRIAMLATELGFKQVINAQSADDAAVMQALDKITNNAS